jgi:CheY-like chemotaxis protein/nitrogen-specific signal transduction histidine kinase
MPCLLAAAEGLPTSQVKLAQVKLARVKSKQKSAAKPARRGASRGKPTAAGNDAALAAFAHDFRTALTGILALGELLASSNLGERERLWAAGIKASAEHLGALTTLVIDAAKADAGGITLQREAFSPRRLLEALAQSLAARAEMKGLAAEVAIADDLPAMLVGDPVRLRAALENLIDNAVKFTARGAVRLEALGRRAPRGNFKLTVTITDSGIGLAAAEIKRLFRPFAQASTEIARRYGGAGLGLVIVKRLARLMGGDLTVTSKPGIGSRFSFTALLPLAPIAAVEGNPSGQRKATPAKPLIVLCAEDNPYGRVILNTILTELGHRADFVGSGEEAVEAVKRGYDLVLMDVTLSGIDGLEASRRIRALAGAAARTPIIGISGRSEAGDEQAARAAGMDFYLHKPVSPSALGDAIAAVTSRSRTP